MENSGIGETWNFIRKLNDCELIKKFIADYEYSEGAESIIAKARNELRECIRTKEIELKIHNIKDHITTGDYINALELGRIAMNQANADESKRIKNLINSAQAELEKDKTEYKRNLVEAQKEYNDENYREAEQLINNIIHYSNWKEAPELKRLEKKIRYAREIYDRIDQIKEKVIWDSELDIVLDLTLEATSFQKENSLGGEFTSNNLCRMINEITSKIQTQYYDIYFEKKFDLGQNGLHGRVEYKLNELKELLVLIIGKEEKRRNQLLIEEDVDLLISQKRYQDALNKLTSINPSSLNYKDKRRINEKISHVENENENINGPIVTIHVEGGIYKMNSNSLNNIPSQKVKIDTFEIGKFPITREQWLKVMEEVHHSPKIHNQCPIDEVSWEDTQIFIKRMNEKYPKITYRLPTEAEWEYAAQGGKFKDEFKYAGSDRLEDVGWYIKNSGGKLQPVHRLKPNRLGIFDMSGNVNEWCADQYAPNNKSIYKDMYVLRGGNALDKQDALIITHREKAFRWSRKRFIGFRIVRESNY